MIREIKNGLSAWRRRNRFKNFYSQFIQEGDLCFDIGANVGNRTGIFLSLEAKVIAVEPVEESYNILKQKFSGNEKASILPVAIGSKPEEGVIYISNYSEVCTLSHQFIEKYQGQHKYNIEWPHTRKIPITTLNHLIRDYGVPAFCKIDVEGYEAEVLEGLSQPLKAMSFEYNNRLKKIALECIEILSKFDSLTFNFSPYETMKFSLKTWKTQPEFYQFIEELPMEIKTGDIYVKYL